jgi:hypothetical protein
MPRLTTKPIIKWDVQRIAAMDHIKNLSTWAPRHKGHVIGIREQNRLLKGKDGTVSKRTYYYTYCKTCENKKVRENKKFKMLRAERLLKG